MHRKRVGARAWWKTLRHFFWPGLSVRTGILGPGGPERRRAQSLILRQGLSAACSSAAAQISSTPASPGTNGLSYWSDKEGRRHCGAQRLWAAAMVAATVTRPGNAQTLIRGSLALRTGTPKTGELYQRPVRLLLLRILFLRRCF